MNTNDKFSVGVYLSNPNGSSPQEEASYESLYKNYTALMGAAPTLITSFIDYRIPISQFVSNTGWQAWSNGLSVDAKSLTPVISVPLASTATGTGTPDSQFQAIASGAYDTVYKGIVAAWANQGFGNLYFRPGWEMNMPGPTYAGDSPHDQADWVSAYQRVYTDIHQEAARLGVTATVVWNPGTINYTNANAITNLYPGKDYVDAIGADVYSDMYPYSDGTDASGQTLYHDFRTGGEDTSLSQFMADPVNRQHYWDYPSATKWSNDGSEGHGLSLGQIIAFAQSQGKPFDIPETGAGNAGHDISDDSAFPQWLAGKLDAARSGGVTVGFVNIWDSNGGGTYRFSEASDNKPLEAQAWSKYFGAQSRITSVPNPTILGSGHDSIILQMTEDAYRGDAQYTLSVDGVQVGGVQTETLTRASGLSHQVVINGNWGTGSHTVGVDFLNDLYAGTADTDRNLYVNGSSYNGVASTGTVSLMSSGIQNLTVGIPDKITVSVSEDAYLGDAQFRISVDGVSAGQPLTATALHAKGASQTLSVSGNWGSGYHRIGVEFINDAWGGTTDTDRNLYVDGVTYNGVAVSGRPVELMCNGSTVFSTSSVAPDVTTGSGPDSIVLSVSEDFYLGDAQFNVSIDGASIGGSYTALALHSVGGAQKFTLNGNWGHGAHDVAVSFTNDAWGGTADTDRNLYVNSLAYDGRGASSGTAALMSNGTVHFFTQAITGDAGGNMNSATSTGSLSVSQSFAAGSGLSPTGQPDSAVSLIRTSHT